MPSVYDLKPTFQRLLAPLVSALARAGVTANAVTVAALLLSLAAGVLVVLFPTASWPLWLYPPVLLVRMALNAIDGQLARLHGQSSDLGALLNELGDVASDAALYLPLALLPGMSGWPAGLLVVFVVLAALTELAGVCAVQIGASRRYEGPMGKSDRALALAIAAIALALGVAPHPWMTAFLAVLVAATVLTVVHRCRKALAEAAGIAR